MMIIGPRESPLPRSAPASTWFTQLNSRKKQLARIKSTPYAMTDSSGENSPTAGAANRHSSATMTAVTPTAMLTVITVPRFARSSLPAPMFWLTKVVAAIDMLCMGSITNWSSLL